MRVTTGLFACLLSMGAAAFVNAADSPAGTGSAAQQAEWPLPGGNVGGHQFSALDQINAGNVGKLGLLWYSDLPVGEGLVGNALVRDGIVYQSAPAARVVATDVRTGKTVWLFAPGFDMSSYTQGSDFIANTNRGLTLDDNNVYVAGGCELYAVDRKTGKEVWHSRACEPDDLGVVAPPVVGNGRVYVGITNMQAGTNRSFAAAHDAKTGKQLWRFYTVPGDPAKPFENEQMKMAAASWGEGYWKKSKGAAGVWSGMVYDPTTDLFIFGAGNPGTDGHEKDFADHDLLFSDSIIAVHAGTGAYAWHLQEVKGDVFHPGDAVAHIILADLPIKGVTRHVVMQAAKNGYFYVIDAKTGKFISTNNYVPAINYDLRGTKTGTFEYRKELRYWETPGKSVVLQPGGWGGHTWELSSYSPKTGLVYIPGFVFPYGLTDEIVKTGDLKAREDYGFKKGAQYETHGRLVAWDPSTQSERWHTDHPVPLNGGVLSTAGGVVFQGTPDMLYAYDATSGKTLWSYNTHSVMFAGPSTVMIDGKQILLVPSGDGTATSGANEKRLMSTPGSMAAPSRLLAFALDAKATLPAPKPHLILQPARAKASPALAAKGEKLVAANGCESCHGVKFENAGNGRIPDLRNIREEKLQAMPAILQQGAFAPLGMPKFPKLTAQDIEALQAYITNTAWEQYEKQQGGRTAAR